MQGTLIEDNIINTLLSLKKYPQDLLQKVDLNIPEDQLIALCQKAQQIFLSQPVLLEIVSPVTICGDIHGQFYDLLHLFDKGGKPFKTNYLFLGDYVDRGQLGIECITLLLAYKVKFPENFFLLRGNHECSSINKIYGFYDECKRKYNTKLWKVFSSCFECLPISCIINDKILCMHGGLSPKLASLQQIANIRRPLQIEPQGLVCDILWSDPKFGIKGWQPSERGISHEFGVDILDWFLEKQELDLICRAHQEFT